MYNKQYFINKFSAIPDSLWCVGILTGINGQHCAIGHCMNTGKFPYEDTSLRILLDTSMDRRTVRINDGLDAAYQQPTPKARILAALADLPDK